MIKRHTHSHTHSANTESTRTTESFSSQSIDKNVSHSTDENASSSQSSQDAMIAYNSTGEVVLPAHEELHSLVVNVQQEGSVPAVPIGENEKEKVYLNDKKTPKQEKNGNVQASHEQNKKKKEKESVSVRKNKTRKEKVCFNVRDDTKVAADTVANDKPGTSKIIAIKYGSSKTHRTWN